MIKHYEIKTNQDAVIMFDEISKILGAGESLVIKNVNKKNTIVIETFRYISPEELDQEIDVNKFRRFL